MTRKITFKKFTSLLKAPALRGPSNGHYCIKAVLHAFNSHNLIGTNPCINKAIHVLLQFIAVNAQLFDFIYTHSGAVTKTDFINSNLHRSEHNLVASAWCKSMFWNWHFLNLCIFHVFKSHYHTTEKQLLETFSSKFSSNKMALCNYNMFFWYINIP